MRRAGLVVSLGLMVIVGGCTPAEKVDTRNQAAPASADAVAAPANPDKAKSLPGPAAPN